jgi:hypothetical protein
VSDLDHFPQRYSVDSDALDWWLSEHRTAIEGSEDTRPAVMAFARQLLATQTRERLAGLLTVAASRLVGDPDAAAAERDELRRQLDEATTDLLADNEQTLTYATEGLERAERYRLAWQSARQRAVRLRGARNSWYGVYSETWDEMSKMRAERDEARAEVVRLGKENEEHRRTIRAWHAAREADEVEFEAWLKRVNDGVHAALAELTTDEQVEERIEKIKRTARERIEARRLRAALDEERIEPEPKVVCPGAWVLGYRCSECQSFCLPSENRRTEGEAG